MYIYIQGIESKNHLCTHLRQAFPGFPRISPVPFERTEAPKFTAFAEERSCGYWDLSAMRFKGNQIIPP